MNEGNRDEFESSRRGISSLPIVTRRNLMITAGVGMTSINKLSQNTTAQDASGGNELWSFKTGDQVWASPTVVDGTVFIGSEDSRIYALDSSDGNKYWSTQTESVLVRSSPTVVDGKVFVGGTNAAESDNNSMYALDADDGSEVWSVKTQNWVRSSPTVVDGTVFVGSNDNKNDNNMHALDAGDGSELWSVKIGNGVISSPTVVDGTVFVGSNDNNVYALNAGDGSELWSVGTESGYVVSSPTVIDGKVFVGGDDGSVYALDAGDGSELWSVQITNGYVRSSPTVFDETVFIGSDDGNVYALDVGDGSELWSVKTGGPVRSSPTVVDGTVFVGSNDNNVYALNAGNGSELWSFGSGSNILSSPTVVDGTVFIASFDQKVYALDAGIKGSSKGSRVNLGTLGHHNEWADKKPESSDPDPNPKPNIIFQENFEDKSTGTVPEKFVLAGNDNQEVDIKPNAETALHSYRMSGSHGGCWEAIMRRNLFSEADRPNAMRIQGSFRLGDGSTGCHSHSTIGWRTVDSSSWSDGTGPSILNFDPDGTITSAGETVGKYNRYEWVDFTVEYEYDADDGEVTQKCTIDGGDPVTVTRDQRSQETALTALELKSGDYTVYWDDFLIEEIDGVDESPEETGETLDPSITQSSGTATPDETVTFDASGSTGNITSYDWQLGDGTTATGSSVSHSYDDPDTYTVTLTTKGGDGSTATTRTEIVVAEEDELTFSIKPESPVVGQSITFEATGGDEYEWEFGDDTTASGQQVTHTYDTDTTFTVTLSSSADSVSRDIEIEPVPVSVTNITREFGGVPLQSIQYEDTFRANIDSDTQLDTVEFELGDETKTANSVEEIPEATFDLGILDESSTLTVTATDVDGFEATAQQTVAITPVPDWMEWLVESAEIAVDTADTQIDITHNPLDLSGYSFSLGSIPIDTAPPGFDSANAGAEVAYDTTQQAAVLEGDGGVETELFGYGFEAELDVEGAIDSDLDLVDASGLVFASISAQIGPPMHVDIPAGVPCLPDEVGIETTIAPGMELEADFDGEFDLEKGTVTPETELTVGTELDICGTGAGAEVSGELDASFDVGTPSRNLTGTISAEGDVWVNVSILELEIDAGFEVVLPAGSTRVVANQAQSEREPSWSIADKRGSQPAVGVPSVDASSISTASTSPLAPTADGSNGYQRLTDRSVEDTQPAMTTVGGETLVMWSSQRESASATAGRDIAYRSTDGAEWSEVQYLTSESRSHEAPAVAASNGTALAAWEHVATDITADTGPADIHPHIEIAYAIYDGETWSEPTILTGSSSREFQPTVAPADNGWVIGWEQETDPAADTGQRNVRYTEITTDDTVGDVGKITDAVHPDTGAHPDSGAVLGYASLSDGEPTAAVTTRIIDGSQTDSQRFNASSVRSLTVGSDRLIWQEGNVSEPTLVEANRDTSGTEELRVRDAVRAVAEPSLATDGEQAVLSYRAYVDSTETRELVYRLNRGSGWIFDRQYVQAPDSSQTVWQPETTFGNVVDQFKTVFAISETSQSGKNDIFLTEHDFLPEYAIAAEGPSGATAGETVTLEYDLRNRGDIDGTQSVTITISNAAGTQATQTYTGLAAGQTVSDSVAVNVDETGEFELAITTGETNLSTAAATSSNFDAESTTVTVATPQLSVEAISTEGAETVGITVSNTGGATASDVPLRVTDGEAELTSTTISELGYGETTTTTVSIDPSSIDRSSEDTVELDPDKTLPKAVSESDRITPTWLLQSDLRVTEEISYRRGTVGQIVADVVVGNGSPVGGSGTLQAKTTDGSVVGETSISIAGTESGTNYTTVSVGLNASVSEDDTLRFAINPSVPDADPTTLSQQTTVGPVLEADQPEARVNLLNTSLSDEPVDGTPSSHTLEFTAENVSADNSSDSFSIELPEAIDVGADDVENVTVRNGDYNVTPSVENNTINFDVNPDTDDTSLVDLDIEVDMTLSADDSS